MSDFIEILLLKNYQHLLNDPQLVLTETLQELWSGYGKISRFFSPKLATSLVIKSVTPPNQVNHPRGWHSDVGHKRKLQSYKIEATFYQHFAHRCDEYCYVPRFIAFEEREENQHALVMEDLQALGFDTINGELTLNDIKAVINWLAYFHARFMDEEAQGLWSVGTYWHIGTREDEYSVMQAGSLKQAAHVIDSTLNMAQYKTLVHGDAKLANFCFGEFKDEQKRAAAVDFQYVGYGVGVKDLAYFLGSCLDDKGLMTLHEELLNHYFNALEKGLAYYNKKVSFTNIEKEWRKLYAFSCADFHRFLLGWSPEHYKINNYLEAQTKGVLAQLEF